MQRKDPESVKNTQQQCPTPRQGGADMIALMALAKCVLVVAECAGLDAYLSGHAVRSATITALAYVVGVWIGRVVIAEGDDVMFAASTAAIFAGVYIGTKLRREDR